MRSILPIAALVFVSTGALTFSQAASPGPRTHGFWHPASAVAMLAPAHHPGAPPLVFTFLDYPATSYTNPVGPNLGAKPNAKFYIAGTYGPGAVGQGDSFGFLAQLATNHKGIMTEAYRPLIPTQSDVSVFGINDAGTTVGTFGNMQGFVLKLNGTPTTIVVPYAGAVATLADGINDSNLVVGTWYTSGNATSFGFTWHNGKFTQLPAYPGGTATDPAAINNEGDIVGLLTDGSGVTHGFLLQGTNFTLIDPPGSGYSIANGINDSGQIVGQYCAAPPNCSGNWQGFSYSQGVYTSVVVPGMPLTSLNGINNSGVAAGTYYDTNGFSHGFLVSP